MAEHTDSLLPGESPESGYVSTSVHTATETHPVIQCSGVTKSFGGRAAVRDVSLALEEGEVLALVGPSGSGKTSFLRLVAGLESPDAGTVALGNRVVAGDGRWTPPEARRLGMVFQDYALFPHLSVAQNVAFGLSAWPKRGRLRRAGQMLDMVRLAHLADRYPHQLSGGEQQRVALARSLAPQPLALLLDEPFSNLDPQLRVHLRGEVRGILRSSKATAIYVTHDQEEALFMGDRVAIMNDGAIEQVGPPEEVFHRPQTRFVARFLGAADFLPGRVTDNGIVTELGVLSPENHVPNGTDLTVLIRPDDLVVRLSDVGNARVINRAFRGMHYLYTLSLPSGLQVHSLEHHSARFPEGASVHVALGPDPALTCFVDGRDVGGSFTARCALPEDCQRA